MEVNQAFVCFLLTICPFAVLCNDKRLLMDCAAGTEERLQALEVTIQALKTQVTQLENVNHNQTVQIQSLQTKVNTPKQGCQTGAHNLDDSQGHAHAKSVYITFNPPFTEVPKVVWGTTGLDIDHNTNIRYATSISGVTAKGFTVTASTWGDTNVYHVGVQWMACPAHQ